MAFQSKDSLNRHSFFGATAISLSSYILYTITLSDCEFYKNSLAVGFSLGLPFCLCHPKNFSNGTWDNFSDRKQVTPFVLKMNGRNSVKEETTQKVAT